MPTNDTTSGTRTQHRASRTLAAFKLAANTAQLASSSHIPEQGPHQDTDQSTRLQRHLGFLQFISRTVGGETYQEPPIQGAPTGVTNVAYTAIDAVTFSITWTPDPLATSYSITSNAESYTLTNVTNSSVTIYFANFNTTPIVTITAINEFGSASVMVTVPACFLAGSPVHMADGTAKAIEEVAVGDMVIGAFGETNEVLALQRVYVGHSKMYRINGEHSTTDHHPHVSSDRKFYTPLPSVIDGQVYGNKFPVIGADGKMKAETLHGLKPGRTQMMRTGITLKTIDGERLLQTLEEYQLPFNTPLYNLVVGGSHTYHVDGYAVTGWPREDDFDYDAWHRR
jgi:Hom_end-associated Hint